MKVESEINDILTVHTHDEKEIIFWEKNSNFIRMSYSGMLFNVPTKKISLVTERQ